VHACFSQMTPVVSLRKSDPHSRHTCMAGNIERRCTLYISPGLSRSLPAAGRGHAEGPR
jgi:hypothetical protein